MPPTVSSRCCRSTHRPCGSRTAGSSRRDASSSPEPRRASGCPFDQRRADVRAGLDTRGFVSGYQGSPLGGVDKELARLGDLRAQLGVEFVPGLNEELAATSVFATQLVPALPGALVEGVTGWWYGKNPGLDRAGRWKRAGHPDGSQPAWPRAAHDSMVTRKAAPSFSLRSMTISSWDGSGRARRSNSSTGSSRCGSLLSAGCADTSASVRPWAGLPEAPRALRHAYPRRAGDAMPALALAVA